MIDTADVYSDALAERILGEAIRGKRNRLLISTKATCSMDLLHRPRCSTYGVAGFRLSVSDPGPSNSTQPSSWSIRT